MNSSISTGLQGLMDRFPSISLSEMDGIRLMNRMDTKYLTVLRSLPAILEEALEYGYMVFEDGGLRIQDYDSIYFDTPELKTYTEHRRGKLVRQKIRTRRYLSSGVCFLEVKDKNNHSRTRKKRMEIRQELFPDFRSCPEACEWMRQRCFYDSGTLSPSLGTSFRRITLVNKEKTERLTIDMDVNFRNLHNGTGKGMGCAVIIELKQDGRTESRMRNILSRHRILPCRISKYCAGITMTTPGITAGRFKLKVRQIEKLNKIC